MIALVSCFSKPFSPAMSAGVLQPASNSSIKSFGFFIRSPSISEDRLHKMIYTLLSFNNCSLFVNHPLLCHPERTLISYFTALTGATFVVLLKENHMQWTEAATLHRKSGGAEGPAVPRTI